MRTDDEGPSKPREQHGFLSPEEHLWLAVVYQGIEDQEPAAAQARALLESLPRTERKLSYLLHTIKRRLEGLKADEAFFAGPFSSLCTVAQISPDTERRVRLKLTRQIQASRALWLEVRRRTIQKRILIRR